MSYALRVSGVRELQRALKGSAELKDFNDELKRLAEPVAQEARARGARYAGIGPFRTGRRGAMALVRQSRTKRTGLRPDFGALQMRTVLIPALEAKQGEVERGVEEFLDHVLDRHDL